MRKATTQPGLSGMPVAGARNGWQLVVGGEVHCAMERQAPLRVPRLSCRGDPHPVHPVNPVHPLPLPGPWELCHRINALNDCTSLLSELSVPGTLPHPGHRFGRRAALSDHAVNMPLLHVKAAQLSCCVRPFAWRVAHGRQQLVPASSKVSLPARSDEAQLLSAVYTSSIGRPSCLLCLA